MFTKTTAGAVLLLAAAAHTPALASAHITELFRVGDTVLSTEGTPFSTAGVGIPSIRDGVLAFPVGLQVDPFSMTALISNRSGSLQTEWSTPEDGTLSERYRVDEAPTISPTYDIALTIRRAVLPSNTFSGSLLLLGSDGTIQRWTNDDLLTILTNLGFTNLVGSAFPSPPRFLGQSITFSMGVTFDFLAGRNAFFEYSPAIAQWNALATVGQIPVGAADQVVRFIPTNVSFGSTQYIDYYHATDAGRILAAISTGPNPNQTPFVSHLAIIENGVTTILHSQGDPIPNTSRSFDEFGASKITMRGDDYAFTARDSEGDIALYAVIDGEFRTIIDASTPIPGGLYGEPATFGQNGGPSFGGIAMNDDYIVFTASPRRTTGPFDNGIFAYNGDSLHKVLYAFEGTLPGSHRFESAAFGPEGLDDDNTIVFKAYTYDENNALGYGIYSIQLDGLITPCPGDITGSGTVGLDDFAVLAANFGTGPGATREQGDLNDDGFVDLADFNILAVNFGNDCD